MVRGREEVAASSLDEQFAELDDDEDELEVQTRLAQLKSGPSDKRTRNLGGALGAVARTQPPPL